MIKHSFMAILVTLLTASFAVSGEVRTLTLDNGLDLVMMPDASSPLISSLVIVKAGSAYETLETAGATHMLEHMMFRGTETRTQGEIYDGLDLAGAYNNAQTSKTCTNYILVVPKEHAGQAMEIQADMVLNSTVPADTYEVEKGRVIAEIEQSYNRPSYPAELAHRRNLFGDTPYSFPTLGSVNGIRNLEREVVVGFHDDWYVVNNMTLVLRGDLTFREMERLAKKVYGAEPAKALPDRPESWPVGFDSWRQGRLNRTYGETGSPILHVSFPAPLFSEADYPTFTLVKSYFDDQLDKKLRGGERPLVMYSYSQLVNDPAFSVLEVTASVIPGIDVETVVDSILSAANTIARMEYSDASLRRRHESMLQDELFFSEQVQYGSFLLVPKLALAPYGYWEDFERRRAQVTAFAAAETAANWFTDPLFVADAYLPYPPAEEAEGVTLGPMESEVLENGLVIHAREVKGAPVGGIHLVIKHRAQWEGKAKRGWADLLHRLMLQGYNDRDREQLEREIDDLGMDISTVDDPRVPMDDYRTTPEYSYVRIQVLPDRWASALVLLGKLLEYPRLNEETLEKVTSEQMGIIENGRGRLNRTAGELFTRKLYGEYPLAYSVYGDGGSYDNLSVAAMREFHELYFSPDNMILSVFAPAAPEEVVQVAERAFGNLVASRLKMNPPAPESEGTTAEVSGKGRQGYLATGFLVEELPGEDVAALTVANAMVSDLVYRDLGEKRGWAYGAGSSLVVRDGWAAWKAALGLPEEHLREAKEIIYGHLEKIAGGEFDEHRMEVARQSILGKTLRRYSSRVNLAMAAGRDDFFHHDPMFTWKTYEQIQQVTFEQVRQAAKKYFSDPDEVVTIYGKPAAGSDENKGMPKGMMRGMGGGG